MSLPKDFLWGGALAAHQFEGGVLDTTKGLSVADVMTGGNVSTPRVITDGVKKDYIIQTISVLISIIITRKISSYSQKWALNVLEHLLPGQESSQEGMKKHLMKKV